MYRIVWTPRSLRDLDRLEDSLFGKSPKAAASAIEAIITATAKLAAFPNVGRVRDDLDLEHRELLVPFSSSGYVVHYGVLTDSVEILDIRHQREAGLILPP